jgi:RHS repeat-associated protein
MKHEAYNTVLNKYKAVANETVVELKGIPSGGGGVADDSSKNLYRFNGQEYQSEFDLNVTAMDYRQYDNAIGKFNCVDPVSHHSESPYCFAANNPVFFSDPSGADYALDWAANTAYLNSSLGSSSNWGQSAVGGNAIGFMTAFESSVYTTSTPSGINGIIGYYATQNGFSGFSYTYSEPDQTIASPGGLGAGFYQYSQNGNGINGLGGNTFSNIWNSPLMRAIVPVPCSCAKKK